MNYVNCFKAWSSHPLQNVPELGLTIFKTSVWSFYPILFIHLWTVSELGPLVKTSHLIIWSLVSTSIFWILFIWSSSSSVFNAYVDLINCLNAASFDHPIPYSSSVSRAYVNLVNNLDMSHLIIPSSPGCKWIWSTVRIPFIWLSILFIHHQWTWSIAFWLLSSVSLGSYRLVT